MYASQFYQSECVWEEHTKTIATTGLPVTTIVEYEDIAIYFIHLGRKQKRTDKGYFNVEAGQAIVPYVSLDDQHIIPSTHTSHIRRGNQTWRIVGIDDYSNMMQNHNYHFDLERVELNDQ
jgi:hypothetical protein